MQHNDHDRLVERRQYLLGHRASGLNIGDMVRVIRKAASWECGWNCMWSTRMDVIVGKICEITADIEEHGFQLDRRYCFPYFVLEKTGEKMREDECPLFPVGSYAYDTIRHMVVMITGISSPAIREDNAGHIVHVCQLRDPRVIFHPYDRVLVRDSERDIW